MDTPIVPTKEELKNIRIESVGEMFYGMKVIKTGKTNSFAEMDSLKIYPDNTFYRFSTGEKGDVFDFVQMVSDCNFKIAANMLFEYYTNHRINIQNYTKDTLQHFQHSATNSILELPQKNEHNKNVFAYLTKTRGIKPKIVNHYIKYHTLYQDTKNNCVFVGYVDGVATCASIRSTYSNFKGEVSNSFSEVGIYSNFPENKNTTLVICEGMIDVMSYQSLLDDDYKNMDYLSTQGVSKGRNAIFYRMKKEEAFKQYKKMIICYDNDPVNPTLGYSVGRKHAEELKEWITQEFPGIEVTTQFPQFKDYNEDLLHKINQNYHKKVDL